MQVKQTLSLKAPIRPQSAGPKKETPSENAPIDGYVPGSAQSEAPAKPSFQSTSSAAPKPAELTDNPEAAGLHGWQRALLVGMTGVLGMGALAGCTNNGGTGTTTSTNTEAMKALNTSFESIEKSMKDTGGQSSGQVAGKVLNSIAEYSRATGEKGHELMDNLAGTIRSHPVLAASIAFAAGSAVGISLDQFGVTDKAMDTAGDVVNWVKENPIKSIAIGVAVAGAGYLVYDNLIKPMAEVPQAPKGEQADAMEKTFQDLEKQIKEENKSPQEVSKTLTQKIKDYAKATGRSAAEVKNDVMAWSYEHPIVATSMVAGAGVATGVLLSQAGVPEYVAGFAGTLIDQAGNGVDTVTQFAKDHPVVAGAVAAGIAAGAGYLIYQAVN